MHQPFAPRPFFLLLGLVVVLVTFVQVGALTLAFDKLGLSPESALMLLLLSLMGSAINLPLFTIRAEARPALEVPAWFRGLLRHPQEEFRGLTRIAVNVGGCLVPVAFSIYLIVEDRLPGWPLLAVTGTVTAVSYLFSRPIAGIGIGMPVFVAPVTAAMAAVTIDPAHSAPLAYVGGTWGVLIGADLLRFRDIRLMGTPFASIGGAGTFDGIFITGIVAVLLA